MAKRKSKFKEVQSGIIILGEGPTEQYYFKYLKRIFSYGCTIQPRLCNNTCINDFERKIKELLLGEIQIVCVFDADVSLRNEKENRRLENLKRKYIKNDNVLFCDSFPTIEYWFILHFKDTCPNYDNSGQVVTELKRYITNYQKTKSFLDSESWVMEMSIDKGSMEHAKARAMKYQSREASYSNIYKAVDLLEGTK